MTGSDIWNELGNTYFKAGSYDEAIDAYNKAIELNPRFGWAYSSLALAYTRKGRLAEAIPLFQKSISLLTDKGEKAVTWNRLGDVYRQLSEYDSAAHAYETADRLSPGSATNNVAAAPKAATESLRAEAARENPAPVRPVRQLNGIQDADLKNAHLWNELGNILLKDGSYDEASDAYRKAMKLDPAFGWPYSNLGLVYTYQGNFPEAIPLYKKSIELFTNDKDKAISWERLGEVYRRLNIYKDAIAAYEIAKKLAQESDAPQRELRELRIEQIISHPRQANMRAGVDELAESIRVHGILQPLLVRPVGEPVAGQAGKYMLIAGKRRLEAARQLGLENVPAIICRVSEQEMFELAANENMHRAEPNPLELAETYQRLIHEFGMSEDDIAASVGKTRYIIANTLQLLQLPEDVRQALACRRISEAQARLLFTISLPEMQSIALQNILRNELNTRQTEDLVRRMSRRKVNEEPEPVVAEAPTEVDFSEVDPLPASLDQVTESYQPESAPLMTRARFIMMSNPRVERKSQLVSS